MTRKTSDDAERVLRVLLMREKLITLDKALERNGQISDEQIALIEEAQRLLQVPIIASKLELDDLIHATSVFVHDGTLPAPKGSASLPQPSPQPPARHEYVLRLAIPQDKAEWVIGDFQEQFVKDCKRYGEKRARGLYRAGVLQIIGPMLWQRTKKIGLFGLIIAAVKSWVS